MAELLVSGLTFLFCLNQIIIIHKSFRSAFQKTRGQTYYNKNVTYTNPILHVPVYIVISGHYELATRFPFLISHALDRSMYNYIYMKYVMMMYMIYYIWISSWFMMLNGDGVSYDSCRRNFTGTRCAIPNPNIREFSDGMVSDVFPPFIQALCIDYQHRMSCSFWVYSDFSPANYFFFHI